MAIIYNIIPIGLTINYMTCTLFESVFVRMKPALYLCVVVSIFSMKQTFTIINNSIEFYFSALQKCLFFDLLCHFIIAANNLHMLCTVCNQLKESNK